MKDERYKAECRHFLDMMKTFSELLTVLIQINIVQDEINRKTK